MAEESKHFSMGPHMTVIGMMESSKKGCAHIPMENFMKGNGSKENLMELESRHGLTVANMMDSGIWESPLGRARRSIQMEELRKDIGRTVLLLKEVSQFCQTLL
jgi:hypothetical protein